MKVADETLMAYADGELDPAMAEEIEAVMAQDPLVARRVAQFRTQQRQVRAAFDGVLRETVPTRLVAATEGIRSIGPARRWRWRQVVAMAASVAAGAVVTWGVLRSPAEPMIATTASGFVAQGDLARSLSRNLAGDHVAGPVRLGLSFRDRSGSYCRTFVVSGGDTIAGLACRTRDIWQVQVAAAGLEGSGAMAYRPAAGALPPAVLRAVEDRMAGEPLDADGERLARARGWVEAGGK